MRALIVESSHSDYLSIKNALGDQFQASCAGSLDDALARKATETWDLVIIDVGTNVNQADACFQKAYHALTPIPILVLSEIDDDELSLRMVQNGAQDCIAKSRLGAKTLARAARHAIERGRVERQARENEQFARATLDSLSAHIAILDDKGIILAVNRAWKRFGNENGMIAAGYGIGSSYLSPCDESTRDDGDIGHAVAAGIRSVLSGEKDEFCLEYPCHSPTEERWFMMRATPFVGDGPTRIVVSHENTTSRKIAERLASESVAAMEQVLRVVGRELRSPMSAVRGITEFMMTVGAEDAAASERFLNEISQEVGRMTDTVENILDAAEIKSGRINWRSAEVDLPEVVDEAIASTLPLIDAARLQICHTSDETAGPISGDVQALRRLAFNLLSHGRKHVSGGRIEVQSRQYQDADGCWAEIVVQCLGCTKISDPEPSDETLDCDSETAPQGVHEAGLGLDICRIVVAAHGGSLQVKPNPGRGPTMTARFRTDLHKAALNTQGRLAGPMDASQSTPPRRKINLHSPLAM